MNSKILSIVILLALFGSLMATVTFKSSTAKIKWLYCPNIICDEIGCFDHNVNATRTFIHNGLRIKYNPVVGISSYIGVGP